MSVQRFVLRPVHRPIVVSVKLASHQPGIPGTISILSFRAMFCGSITQPFRPVRFKELFSGINREENITGNLTLFQDRKPGDLETSCRCFRGNQSLPRLRPTAAATSQRSCLRCRGNPIFSGKSTELVPDSLGFPSKQPNPPCSDNERTYYR